MEKKNKRDELFREMTKKFCSGRNNLLGRVLTIIDSSFNDPVQRKAAKDLIQKEFYSEITFDWSDTIKSEVDSFLDVFTSIEKSSEIMLPVQSWAIKDKYKELK